MKKIKEVCKPREGVFDANRRDTVLDLTDLAADRIEPSEFFAENHITEGMKKLLQEGFRRLENKSTQGVFKLTQAMGGGKTHNLLAFGLLAKHPEYREQVMRDFYVPSDIGNVRVVAFSGRESDAPLGIWGAIAEQLDKKDQFNDYYSPLSAPGQTAWVNLLQGDPLVIMLDELPPYFVNAASKTIGNSDLSVVTTTALSNLLVAIGREELSNVCLIITDLTASYAGGAQQIISALQDLERETGRSAMNLEPVRMNTDEFYQILRKRIFEEIPDTETIEDVAQGYAQAVRAAKQMEITNASPEQFSQHIMESYPFHPSIRDLYARFKENPGFQQTRGLIRLMRIVVARIWNNESENPYLIAAHDLDLHDRETLTEINQINNTLENAIAHDIASNGQSVAELMDTNVGGVNAQDVMKLLLVASLANVPGAIKGLAVPEIIANLCAPERDISRLQSEIIGSLITAAWYLHTSADGKLHIKNVQNLIARVKTTADAYLRDQSLIELKERLKVIFNADTGWCYQSVLPLPAIDEIDIKTDKVTLIISEPHPQGLHPDLETYYKQLTFPNRICFLTGQRAFDSLLARSKELKAIDQVIAEMYQENIAESDPQMQQARDQLLPRFVTQFNSAIRESFSTLYYPTKDRLSKADFTMEFKENRFNGEEQIINTLKEKQKYTEDISGETFRKKVEARIFTQQVMKWSEVKRKAATNTVWQWHKSDALDKLKDDCIHKDTWREDGGFVDKGPFEKPETSVNIQQLSRNDETGQVKLRLTPVNGDTLYAEIGGKATSASMKIEQREFETNELKVSFLCIDSKGDHKTGEDVTWSGIITLKSRVYGSGSDQMVELKAAPPAPIKYTTNGADPKVNGGVYDEPFIVPAETQLVLCVAERDGMISEVHRRKIEPGGGEGEPIDPDKPVVWTPSNGIKYSDTRTSYGLITRMKKYNAKAGGLRIAVLGDQWADLSLSPDILLDGQRIEEILEDLRALPDGGEVTIDADYLSFERGQYLLDYAEELKIPLKRDEVEP